MAIQHISSCRNDFLHGNPVTPENLLLPESGRLLTSHAATLYRLALSSFLELAWKEPIPEVEDVQAFPASVERRLNFERPQSECEEALKLCRVSVDEQRRNRESQRSDEANLTYGLSFLRKNVTPCENRGRNPGVTHARKTADRLYPGQPLQWHPLY